MTKKAKSRKPWKASNVQILEHKIDKKDAKQLLTEIGELIYDLACQLHHNQKNKPHILNSNDTDSKNIEVSV